MGVAVSVVAGVLTFGTGAIIGLSVTAAAALALGGGFGTVAGIVTHTFVKKLEKTEEELEKLCTIFIAVGRHSMDLYKCIVRVHHLLEHNSAKVEDVEQSKKTLPSFGLLKQHLGELRELALKCKNVLEEKRGEMDAF